MTNKTNNEELALKDHEIAKIHNDLRDAAIKFHGFQSLREKMVSIVSPLVRANSALNHKQSIIDKQVEEIERLMAIIHKEKWPSETAQQLTQYKQRVEELEGELKMARLEYEVARKMIVCPAEE